MDGRALGTGVAPKKNAARDFAARQVSKPICQLPQSEAHAGLIKALSALEAENPTGEGSGAAET